MELLLIAGGLVVLLMWVSSKKGKSVARADQAEEILDDIRQAKEIRDSLNDRSVRDKLRAFLDKRNK